MGTVAKAGAAAPGREGGVGTGVRPEAGSSREGRGLAGATAGTADRAGFSGGNQIGAWIFCTWSTLGTAGVLGGKAAGAGTGGAAPGGRRVAEVAVAGAGGVSGRAAAAHAAGTEAGTCPDMSIGATPGHEGWPGANTGAVDGWASSGAGTAYGGAAAGTGAKAGGGPEYGGAAGRETGLAGGGSRAGGESGAAIGACGASGRASGGKNFNTSRPFSLFFPSFSVFGVSDNLKILIPIGSMSPFQQAAYFFSSGLSGSFEFINIFKA